MRIITGTAKGIKLNTLEGENTRPTAERVKEAVFSMIQFDIEGRKVLDLFSGSGQMALEALSRGAANAVAVDRSKDAVAIIKGNVRKCHFDDRCHVYQSDYLDFIKRSANTQFDIIFLDPPYAMKMYAPALRTLLTYGCLKPSTLIICESGEETVFDGDDDLASRFVVEKQTKYSRSFITIFKPALLEV